MPKLEPRGRKIKILATLGPASREPAMIALLGVTAEMNSLRFPPEDCVYVRAVAMRFAGAAVVM